MDRRAIGIFDSGVGGLTVCDKIFRSLPGENVVYLGDTARVPYGNKSGKTVTRFSGEIVKFLLGFKVKLIIVACNTASSLSLPGLKRSCPVPIIGVIKPGVREALKRSKSARIGIIGTESTISSGVYADEIRSINKSAHVAQKACPIFVPLVENMWFDGDITARVARKYLSPLLKRKIDSLILGCTHYPLLKKVIQRVVGRKVALIDSSTQVAKYAKELLGKNGLESGAKKGKARFFATDDTKKFEKLARVFLGKKIKAGKAIL